MRRYRSNRLHPMVATKELTLALMETTYAIYGDVSIQNVVRLVSGPRLILREGVADALSGAVSGVQNSAAGADIGKLIQVAMVLAPVIGAIFTTAKVGSEIYKIGSFTMTHGTRTMGLLLHGKESPLYKDWFNKKKAKLLKTNYQLRKLQDEMLENPTLKKTNTELINNAVNGKIFSTLVDKVTNLSHKIPVFGDMDPKLKLVTIVITLLLAGLPFGITQRIYNMLKKAIKFGYKAAKAAVKWLITFIRHLLFGKSQGDVQKEEEDAKREEEFLKSLEGEE